MKREDRITKRKLSDGTTKFIIQKSINTFVTLSDVTHCLRCEGVSFQVPAIENYLMTILVNEFRWSTSTALVILRDSETTEPSEILLTPHPLTKYSQPKVTMDYKQPILEATLDSLYGVPSPVTVTMNMLLRRSLLVVNGPTHEMQLLLGDLETLSKYFRPNADTTLQKFFELKLRRAVMSRA